MSRVIATLAATALCAAATIAGCSQQPRQAGTAAPQQVETVAQGGELQGTAEPLPQPADEAAGPQEEVQAAAEPQTQPAADIDSQAERVLRAMSDTLGRAKAFRVHVAARVDEPTAAGQLVQITRESTIVIRRPAELYSDVKGGEMNLAVWYRAGTLNVLDRDDNTYATTQTPDRIESMLDHLADTYHLALPLADLLFPTPFDVLTADVQTGTYVGLDDVAGRRCHHLLFTQEAIDWQIWVDSEGPPLPCKIVITYKDRPLQPQYVAILDQWDLSPSVTEAIFEFRPPQGAKQVQVTDLLETEQEEGE